MATAERSPSPEDSGCEGSGRYVITLPMRRPPMTSNDQRRAHWTTVRKAKAAVAEQVVWMARKQLPRGLRLERVSVRVTWWAPDARRRDSDSLGPFLKAALDALTVAGVIPDDNSAYVAETRQRIEIDRDNPRITIEVEDLTRKSWVVTAPATANSVPEPVAAAPHPTLRRPTRTVLTASPTARTGEREAAAVVAAEAFSGRRVSLQPVPSQPRPAQSSSVLRDVSKCVECGSSITQPGTGRPRKTCSAACRVRVHRKRKKF